MNIPEILATVDQLDDSQLHAFVQSQDLTQESVWRFKDYGAQFHLTDPARALHIAEATSRVATALDLAPLGDWTRANALVFLDRYAEALALFAKTRAAYLQEGNVLDAARASVGYVFVLAYTGQCERALTLAQTIEPTLLAAAATDPGDQNRLHLLWLNVGVAYEFMGDFEECLAVNARLYTAAAALDNRVLMAQALHNQAAAQVQLNHVNDALDAYGRAEEIFVATGDTEDLARLYANLLIVLARLQRFDEVRRTYRKGEAQLAGKDTSRELTRLRLLYALVRMEGQGDFDDAMVEQLQQAAQRFLATGALVDAGLAHYALGLWHLHHRHGTAAAAAFGEAQTLAQRGGNRVLEWQALYGLGLWARTEGRLDAAIGYLKQAVARIESMRRELRVEEFRANFLTDKLTVYRTLVGLYLTQGQPELAFQEIERIKSRLVSEKLTYRLRAELTWLDDEHETSVRMLVRRLQQRFQALDVLYGKIRLSWADEDDGQEADAVALRGELRAAEEAVKHDLRALQRLRPQFAPYEFVTPIDVASLAADLDGSLFIQYFVCDGRFDAMVVGAGNHVQAVQLAPVDDVRRLIDAWDLAVTRMVDLSARLAPAQLARLLPALMREAQTQLAGLYDALLRPLAALIPPEAEIVIAPDDVLFGAPFHAFYDGERYLATAHVVRYVPSGTVRKMSRVPTAAPKHALVMGSDLDGRLPAVVHELHAVAQLLRAQAGYTVTLRAGAEADVATLRTGLPDCRLVHIAAHANFRSDDPMLSTIAFADRRLTLAELSGLPCRAELVVLSGCETGSGRLLGSDWLSLAGGFLGAGARSLLVSLWRAEDRVTARLMAEFYGRWLGGMDRAHALQQAQLALLDAAHAEDDLSHAAHPALWAPFILIGG